ncbi:MAG TPA: hypothetical protein VKO87_08525, partial [Gemmatimonadaceae bacterium]|nr:hypothetical protein [Gemmatimonadaceae bacterium]
MIKQIPLFVAVVVELVCLVELTPADAAGQVPVGARYSSVALQDFIGKAAGVNAQIPERLRAYRARVETEMSIALLDSGRRERTAQIEQIASDVRFRNPDRYDQRVVGYRNQSVGPTFSL